MILIGFAAAFGHILTMLSLPMQISLFFTGLSSNPYMVLLAINVLLLILGTLMDMAPLILILTPILLPVVTHLGVHPVHFGMIMMVNLGIGLITPPVGSVLFVASAVSNQKMEAVTKAMLPFFGALFAVLMIVTYVPQVSLWLPRLTGELNNPPSLVDDVATTAKGQAVTIEVLKNDSDKEKDPITIEKVTVIEGKGEAATDGSVVTFTPAPDFTGKAVLEYRGNDLRGGPETANVTINVTP